MQGVPCQGMSLVEVIQKDIANSLSKRQENPPHLVELNQGTNGELGPVMKQVSINYRGVREKLMEKLLHKSRDKYYKQQYGLPFKPLDSSVELKVESKAEDQDLYSDLDEYNRKQTLITLQKQAEQYINFNETLVNMFDD